LGKIMESLLNIKSISNPQVMFAAIGDTEYDKAPLQVTQFESDNRIEAQLKELYLEGGGGGNKEESYNAIWYFAAHKTKLDSLQTGKRGLLFTMGDELMPSKLKADHIKRFIDKNYVGTDILTSELVKQVSEKYDVFHLIVQDTSTYHGLGENKMNACWQQYLGERAISVASHMDIPQKIVATIQSLCELSLQMEKLGIDKKSAEIAEKEINPIAAGNIGKFGLLSSPHPDPLASLSTLNKDSDNIPYLFVCPISHEPMEDPVVAEDGFTYERSNIAKWLEHHNTSPKTNKIIYGKSLIPNQDLRGAIREWKEKQASSLATSITPSK
jgi:hypothetical protein